ncbi:MAG: hypothetical protein EG828_09985 [Deltaproteobacteria bacterium]|nr:hypothetical protein [Deltaproteobacteria bacterium]
MQLTINMSLEQTQLEFRQRTFSQQGTNGPQSSLPSSSQDRVELSDEARRPQEREPSIGQVRKAHHDRNDNAVADLLKNILEQITGAQINEVQNAPAVVDPSAMMPQIQETFFAVQQANVAIESSSLLINGAINTDDGAKVAFALDLQIMHASASTSAFNLNAGPNGYEFGFAGSSADLTSTSFNFSLTSETPDGSSASGSGLGNFLLKDELKDIRQALKPLVKEFMHDTGFPSDKRSVNKFLHTIA